MSTEKIISSIQKPKIKKGRSYAAKTSMLEKALKGFDFSGTIDLVYLESKSISILLTAYFWTPNKNVPYDRFYIQISNIESTIRKEIYHLIEQFVFPKLVEWMTKMKNLSNHSTILLTPNVFQAFYENGKILINNQ